MKMSNNECEISDNECEISNNEYEISNNEYDISDNECEISDNHNIWHNQCQIERKLCKYVYCTDLAKVGSNYCSNGQCAYSGCSKHKIHIGCATYCDYHTCDYSIWCNSPKTNHSPNCLKHSIYLNLSQNIYTICVCVLISIILKFI